MKRVAASNHEAWPALHPSPATQRNVSESFKCQPTIGHLGSRSIKRRSLDLFTGETFYTSVDASIREAILNSIDAIGRREAAGETIQPRIDVTFDRQSSTVTVSDNGDGMGVEQLRDLFSRISASAARVVSDAERDQYNAVGEFGDNWFSF